MLLDAASLYFRAFYGVPTSVTTPDGRPINAVRGFLDMTARLLTTHGPDRLVACWDDDWRPAFRVEALPSYKAHRVAPEGGEEVPDELSPQVPVLDRGARRGRHRPRRRARATRPTTSSARWPPAPAGRSTSSPATGTCSSSSTTTAASGCSTPPAASPTSSWSTRRRWPPSTASPAAPTPTSPCCAATPATGCPASPASGAKTAAALINEFGDLAGIRAAVARTVVPRPPLTAAVLKKMHAAGGLPRRRTGGGRGRVRPSTCRRSRARSPARPADPAALAGLAAAHGLESSLRRLGAALGWPEDALG